MLDVVLVLALMLSPYCPVSADWCLKGDELYMVWWPGYKAEMLPVTVGNKREQVKGTVLELHWYKGEEEGDFRWTTYSDGDKRLWLFKSKKAARWCLAGLLRRQALEILDEADRIEEWWE